MAPIYAAPGRLRWGGRQVGLASLAAVTDEPEIGVTAAGHDPTVTSVESEHLGLWLALRSGNP